MTSTVGTLIDDVDYDSIRSKVSRILGSGDVSRGYGQLVYSDDVVVGNQITKAQWDALRYDILTIKYHQDGVLPEVVVVNRGDPIRYGPGNPVTDYDILADGADANRFALATSQSQVSPAVSQSLTQAWTVTAQCTVTATFSSSDLARYFFNSGGKIRFTSTHTGGSGTAQNLSWTALLSAAGTQFLTANSGNVNFYTLTDSYQTMYSSSTTSLYSFYYGGNEYRIEVKSNVADNATGTATQLTFKITWFDNYTDRKFPPRYPDTVDGTLSIIVDEVKAVGQRFPSGDFSVTSPLYTISSIVEV